jgi:hypothetical protein
VTTIALNENDELVIGEEFESVALARRQETRDAWEMADAVYRDVVSIAPEVATSGASSENTGLGKAEERIGNAHRKAGTEVGQTQVHALFVTRRAWPPEERLPKIASFAAHYELRGKDYKNRRVVLERLAKKSSTGHVTRKAVQIWRSERKPPRLRTFLELAEQRIRAGVKSAGNPWGQVAEGDRIAIARMLRQIADEVQAGEFGTSKGG